MAQSNGFTPAKTNVGARGKPASGGPGSAWILPLPSLYFAYPRSVKPKKGPAMKRIIPLLMTMFLAGMFGLPTAQAQQQQQPQLSHTFLKVGDAAPDFTLRSDQATTVKLSDFRGKKTVILAFYVLAFTGG